MPARPVVQSRLTPNGPSLPSSSSGGASRAVLAPLDLTPCRMPSHQCPMAAPGDSVPSLLHRIEHAYEQDKENPPCNVPTSSKATSFRCNRPRPSSSNSPPPPSVCSRYGPKSDAHSDRSLPQGNVPAAAADPDLTADELRAARIKSNEARSHDVSAFWPQVSSPGVNDPIIDADLMDPDVAALLGKGRKFARLAGPIGINH